MSESYRHHRVTREIVIVPIPFEAGPDWGRRPQPLAYPVNHRQPWRPAQAIPRSKRAASLELARRISRQDLEVRAYMQRAREGVHHAG
jgi:hypothetical protein